MSNYIDDSIKYKLEAQVAFFENKVASTFRNRFNDPLLGKELSRELVKGNVRQLRVWREMKRRNRFYKTMNAGC